jgi:hypothetical protein
MDSRLHPFALSLAATSRNDTLVQALCSSSEALLSYGARLLRLLLSRWPACRHACGRREDARSLERPTESAVGSYFVLVTGTG